MLTIADKPAYAQTSGTDTSPDWTQFHRNNMQRWNPYETVLSVSSLAGSEIIPKWDINLGGSQSPVTSSPTVVNGVVYISSADGSFYALNANSGLQIWRNFDSGGGASTPAVANGVVYVGSSTGKVYALNATNGSVLWSYTAAANAVVSSSPAVENGLVYVGVEDNEGHIDALDAKTGTLLWSYSTGAQVKSSPAVANGVVYVGSGNGYVYALNASTGAVLWSYNTGGFVESSPAVANGVVYIGSESGSVYALNGSTGALLWKHSTGAIGLSSPAVANGMIYIGLVSGKMIALDAGTGSEKWSYTTAGQINSSPAVANGVVYVGSDDLYALNASTGGLVFSLFSAYNWDSSPTVVNGVIYASSATSGATFLEADSVGADLYLRIQPSSTVVQQGQLLTYTFPVWNLGPGDAGYEVLNTQVPAGTTFDYIRISGTPGLGTCTTPSYGGTGQIVCHENSYMARNATWTVRLTVKVTAPSGTVITESGTTTEDTIDPNPANNTATVSVNVQ
jgi:uncharacterized repeat protein (TIGR01451 family)